MKHFILLVLIVLTIVGCGAPKPSAQELATQLLTALDQDDLVTMTELFDDDVPLKHIIIEEKRISWRTDRGAIGPLVRLEATIAAMVGYGHECVVRKGSGHPCRPSISRRSKSSLAGLRLPSIVLVLSTACLELEVSMEIAGCIWSKAATMV